MGALDERVGSVRERLVSLWRAVATLFALLAVGGFALGAPATVLLGGRSWVGTVARLWVSATLAVVAAAVLHPRAWARLPVSYPMIRAPMVASVPLAGAVAAWG